MKIIVCGDSFMTAAPVQSPTGGKHFAELFARKKNAEVTYFAREGMSNGGIAIQITTAIKQKPDLILVGISAFDRVEFPVDEPKDIDVFEKDDILYEHKSSLSSYYKKNKKPTLVSVNLNELVTTDNNTFLLFSPFTLQHCKNSVEKLEALQKYFLHLHYPSWKKQLDEWVMYSVLHQLETSNIPYFICFDLLNVVHKLEFISDNKKEILFNIHQLVDIDNGWGKFGNPVLAHTSLECQKQIAEYLLSKW